MSEQILFILLPTLAYFGVRAAGSDKRWIFIPGIVLGIWGAMFSYGLINGLMENRTELVQKCYDNNITLREFYDKDIIQIRIKAIENETRAR